MKNLIIAVLTLSTCVMTIGCATTETTSTDSAASTSAIASSERLDPNLPVVSAPPTGATWGGNSLSY